MYTNIPRYASEKVLPPCGFEITSCKELYANVDAQATMYDYHRDSFYHIVRCKGQGNFHYIKNKKIILNSDCLLIINRDISHKFPKHKCSGNIIVFTDTFFGNSNEKSDFLNHCTLFQHEYVIIPMQSESFISTVDVYFSLIKKSAFDEAMPTTQTMVLCNWLHNLLIIIEREYRLRSAGLAPILSSKDYVLQFKNLLDTRYQTEKQVSFYAKKLRIPERKLSRMVYAVHGISAKSYINEKILLEAILLLKNTTLNQGEIAYKLGFDFAYFIKFFHKHTGVSPAKYRQRENS